MKSALEMARMARAMRDEREHREREEATAQLDKLESFLMAAIRAPGHQAGTETVDDCEVTYTGPLNRLALHMLASDPLGYSVQDRGGQVGRDEEGHRVATAWRISWKRAAAEAAAEATAERDGEGES